MIKRSKIKKKGGGTPPLFFGRQSALTIGQRSNTLELLIELRGQALTSHRQNSQGVFMHPQLSISNLHPTHKLF